MGVFDNGPLTPEELKTHKVTLYPDPQAAPKHRRNTTRIIATRVCDGEEFEFVGWAEVERLGFDRLQIVDSVVAIHNGNRRAYLKAFRPYEGFTWRIIDPQTHELPPESYCSPF